MVCAAARVPALRQAQGSRQHGTLLFFVHGFRAKRENRAQAAVCFAACQIGRQRGAAIGAALG